MVPRIETARLVLRALEPADFPAYAAIWAEPGVVRFIGGKPRTAEESWASILKTAGTWALFGYGTWAVAARGDGRLLGQVGFLRAHRGFPDLDALPECGWVLGTAAQGRGLGPEAVVAAHDWFDGQGLGASFVMIETGHDASLHVASRAGYRPLRQDRYKEDAVELMVRGR